ncbi:multidrug effflux MFS transporter [Staphylococcus sp. SQ8-PEA]|uniref:Bcr/CflA family efflux transporter n=1 Tax=Staphylococcus marylandisciuri TaxID=2981529 RepID=A0ABT2QT44_9STAP|nr:multidrug effflux MFS transporter [Staphylococcus marylandisciuri]MCU5747125.1 multidrug effflux MFS transporter [Staphylococcus marylandisciuri]
MNQQLSQRFPLMLIIVLGVMTTFGPLTIDMYNVSLTNVKSSFDITASQAQLTLSFAMIGLAIGQFLFGPLSDAFGRKKVALIIIAVYVLASIAAVFTSTLSFFLILRFVQGMTGGGAIVIAKASVGDKQQGTKLAKSISSLLVVNGIVTIVAPLLGGYALTLGNWKAIFILLSLISLVILVLAAFKMEETREQNIARLNFNVILKDYLTLLKKPKFLLPMFIQGLTYVMLFSFASAAPFITANMYHLSPQKFSVIITMNGIGLIVISQLTAMLVEYFNRLTLLVILTTIQMTGVIIIVVTVLTHLPLWVLILGFFLNVCPVTGIGPLSFALAMESRTGGSGNASSLLGLFQFVLGGAVSPLVGIQGENNVIPYVTLLVTTSIIIITLQVSLNYRRRT